MRQAAKAVNYIKNHIKVDIKLVLGMLSVLLLALKIKTL